MDTIQRRVDSFKIHTGQSRTPAHAGQRLLIRRPPISTDGRSEGGVITFPRLFSMEEETSTTMLYDGCKYSSSPPFIRWRPSSQEELKAGFLEAEIKSNRCWAISTRWPVLLSFYHKLTTIDPNWSKTRLYHPGQRKRHATFCFPFRSFLRR